MQFQLPDFDAARVLVAGDLMLVSRVCQRPVAAGEPA
jgi:hypothetical protein